MNFFCIGIRDEARKRKKPQPVVATTEAYYVCARKDCGQKFSSRDAVADHVHRHFETDRDVMRSNEGKQYAAPSCFQVHVLKPF